MNERPNGTDHADLGDFRTHLGVPGLRGSQFGRWIGILAAATVMIINMTWVFAFPVAALVEIFLAALVLYALVVYGGRDRVVVQ